jgi:hypothetical protein
MCYSYFELKSSLLIWQFFYVCSSVFYTPLVLLARDDIGKHLKDFIKFKKLRQKIRCNFSPQKIPHTSCRLSVALDSNTQLGLKHTTAGSSLSKRTVNYTYHQV